MQTTRSLHPTNLNGIRETEKGKSRSRRRGRRAGRWACRVIPGRSLLIAILLTALSVFAVSSTSSASGDNPAPNAAAQASGNVSAPVPDDFDELLKFLKELEKKLAEADELVDQGNARPDDPDPTSLDACLDDAEDIIDLILDPMEDPSLQPASAGAVDPSVAPTTLAEYADECLALAEDAVDEADFGCPPDHAVIGTKIKTIKACLPGYRAAAGL